MTFVDLAPNFWLCSIRQLSLDKTNLETCFEAETKNKERISMKVEELQWRIKNKLELPAPQLLCRQNLDNSNNNNTINNNSRIEDNANSSSPAVRPSSLFQNDQVLGKSPRSSNGNSVSTFVNKNIVATVGERSDEPLPMQREKISEALPNKKEALVIA